MKSTNYKIDVAALRKRTVEVREKLAKKAAAAAQASKRAEERKKIAAANAAARDERSLDRAALKLARPLIREVNAKIKAAVEAGKFGAQIYDLGSSDKNRTDSQYIPNYLDDDVSVARKAAQEACEWFQRPPHNEFPTSDHTALKGKARGLVIWAKRQQLQVEVRRTEPELVRSMYEGEEGGNMISGGYKKDSSRFKNWYQEQGNDVIVVTWK